MSGEPAYLAIQLSRAVSQKLYHPMTCLMVQILPFCVQPYMPSHPMTCLMVQIPPVLCSALCALSSDAGGAVLC
jgi:hypothetical protein